MVLNGWEVRVMVVGFEYIGYAGAGTRGRRTGLVRVGIACGQLPSYPLFLDWINITSLDRCRSPLGWRVRNFAASQETPGKQNLEQLHSQQGITRQHRLNFTACIWSQRRWSRCGAVRSRYAW
jgi:hypothetical protein